MLMLFATLQYQNISFLLCWPQPRLYREASRGVYIQPYERNLVKACSLQLRVSTRCNLHGRRAHRISLLLDYNIMCLGTKQRTWACYVHARALTKGCGACIQFAYLTEVTKEGPRIQVLHMYLELLCLPLGVLLYFPLNRTAILLTWMLVLITFTSGKRFGLVYNCRREMKAKTTRKRFCAPSPRRSMRLLSVASVCITRINVVTAADGIASSNSGASSVDQHSLSWQHWHGLSVPLGNSGISSSRPRPLPFTFFQNHSSLTTTLATEIVFIIKR
jgi:hypothetical protein